MFRFVSRFTLGTRAQPPNGARTTGPERPSDLQPERSVEMALYEEDMFDDFAYDEAEGAADA
ncbi:MAG: hypothetical protein AAF390_12235, partial [Pseudomonadota bacterium]